MEVTRVKPIEVWQRRYNRNVLRAFLEGEKNQNWAVGCLRGIDLETFDSLARELTTHVRFLRYQEIPETRQRLADNSSQC